MKVTAYMQERVFYFVELEVPDDADDEFIEKAAEEAFVQGDYVECGQDDRHMTEWEER